MKPYLLVTPLLLLILSGTVSQTLAKETPKKPATSTATLSKKIYVQNTAPSELARRIEEIRSQSRELTRNPVELTPKDSHHAIIVRGTPEAVAELQDLCKVLDAKPRVARIGLRLIKIERTQLGVDKETLYESSFVNVTNGVKKEVAFQSGASETKIIVLPRINGDNSVSLGVAFDISNDSDFGRYGSSFTSYRRLEKPNEWRAIGAQSLAKTRQGAESYGLPIPTYRLEATIAAAK